MTLLLLPFEPLARLLGRFSIHCLTLAFSRSEEKEKVVSLCLFRVYPTYPFD